MEIINADSITNVGDLHMNSVTPRSRLDDFSETTIDKLRQVKNICIDKGYKIIICAGDIFHRNKQPVTYLNKVKMAFKEFKDEGIQWYVTAGNHDLLHDKLENLDRSPLGNILLSDIIKPLGELLIKTSQGKKIYIKGFHFPEQVEPVGKNIDCDISVCVAHRFFDGKYGTDNLTVDDIKGLGYNIYMLGHDHISYDPVKVGKSLVIRPGSLLRGTSHNYNLKRNVVIDTIKFLDNNGKMKLNFVRDKLRIAPAENVFSSSILHKKEDKSDLMLNLSENIDNLLKRMSDIRGGSSVYKVIDEMEIESCVKERIELYLENYGIYRVGGV